LCHSRFCHSRGSEPTPACAMMKGSPEHALSDGRSARTSLRSKYCPYILTISVPSAGGEEASLAPRLAPGALLLKTFACR
jgi:hypothetical protein